MPRASRPKTFSKPVHRIGDRRQRPHLAAVVAQRERDGRPAQLQLVQERGDPREFGARALEEFAPRRHEREQIVHDDFRSRRRRAGDGVVTDVAVASTARARISSPRAATRSPDGRQRRCSRVLRRESRGLRWRRDRLAILSLLVAWRISASDSSSRPDAPAVVGHRDRSAAAVAKLDDDRVSAPASRLFSTSSLTTETGRSMTSPAAICAIVASSRRPDLVARERRIARRLAQSAQNSLIRDTNRLTAKHLSHYTTTIVRQHISAAITE